MMGNQPMLGGQPMMGNNQHMMGNNMGGGFGGQDNYRPRNYSPPRRRFRSVSLIFSGIFEKQLLEFPIVVGFLSFKNLAVRVT